MRLKKRPASSKLRGSLLGTTGWLERNASAVLAAPAPDRDLSFLEVSLFCLVEHLEFRFDFP